MGDLMTKNTSQWYSSLKRMTAHDQQKNQKVIIPDINHLPDEEQVERIAEQFSKIPNEYDQLKKEDIIVPPISEKDILKHAKLGDSCH